MKLSLTFHHQNMMNLHSGHKICITIIILHQVNLWLKICLAKDMWGDDWSELCPSYCLESGKGVTEEIPTYRQGLGFDEADNTPLAGIQSYTRAIKAFPWATSFTLTVNLIITRQDSMCCVDSLFLLVSVAPSNKPWFLLMREFLAEFVDLIERILAVMGWRKQKWQLYF